MILLTGHGHLATALANQIQCDLVSARSMSNDELEDLVGKYDVIVHNSANLKCETFQDAIRDNFELTHRILNAVHKIKPTIRFFFLSSMSVLKTGSEYTSIQEMNNYTFSKYLAETLCLRYPLNDITCFRFSTLFVRDPGKDGLSRLIHEATKTGKLTLLNGGLSRRDFIPIDIAAAYLVKFIKSGSLHKKVYNVASGISHSFREVSDLIRHRLPDLEINNQEAGPAPDILHQFDVRDLNEIGRIEFRLEDQIDEYISSLKMK